MNKFLIVLPLVFLTLLAIFLPGFIKENVFILGGSTSVYNIWSRAAILLENQKAPFKVYYNSIGSYAALKHVRDGIFDIGYASYDVPISSKDARKIAKHTIATDYLLMIYKLPDGCQLKPSASNKFFLTDSSTIKRLFETADPTWKHFEEQLKLNYNCSNQALSNEIIRIIRENGSGTRDSFETFFGLQKINYHYEQQMKSTNQLLKTLINEPGAISYISISYAKQAFTDKSQANNLGLLIIKNDQAIKALFDYPANNLADNEKLLNALKEYGFKRKFVGLYLKTNQVKLTPLFSFIKSKEFVNLLTKIRLKGHND